MSTINRVATANMYDKSIRNIGGRQNSLVDLNEKLTAGKRVLRASDDPVSAAQAERAITRMERIKVEQQALNIQRNAVAQAESTMGDAINIIQNMRELMVNAGDGTHSPQDRRIIAGQIEALRDELVNISNRKDTNGQPLLGALGSALQPFIGNTPDGFLGLAGQSSGSAVGIPTMLDGDSGFMFQTKRDGAYTADITGPTTTVTTPAAPPLPATINGPLTGRQFSSSEIKVTDAAKINVDPATGSGYTYTVTFGAVVAGTTPGTLAATYTISSTDPAFVPPAAATSADFTMNKPGTIPVTISEAGGATMKFEINATYAQAIDGTVTLSPADGDNITIKPSTGIFDSLDQAINGIANAGNSNAAIQAVGQGLANLDRGMERIQALRGFAGEMLNRADRITGDQEVRNIQLETDRSRAEDLDMVQGISDFQHTQMGYQAALQSYALVQKMSLFNYIS